MKLFTNKFMSLLLACACLVACSQKEESQPAKVTETIVVQEPVLPPTAQKAEEKPVSQPAATPVEVQPAQTVSSKTLYPNEVLLQVKAWDKKLQFLKTHFEQTAQYDRVPVSKSHGVLYYDKNKNMLRLDTTDDDGKTEQMAITDKKQILILLAGILIMKIGQNHLMKII